MAYGKQASSARFLLFVSFAFLSFIAASAHAADVCGNYYPNSGTCTTTFPGGTSSISCSTLTDSGSGCCEEVGCVWDLTPGHEEYFCKGGTHTVKCSDYDNNAEACIVVGCTFQASGTGGCSGSAGGSGYGMPCGSGCAKCLVCDTTSQKCTQKPGFCTTIPAEYVAPPPSDQQAGTGLTPQSAIENLEEGTQGGTGGAVVGSSSNIYKVGWFSDWRAMGLIGVAIVCSIIALAAMIGIAFNMPEVRAFANTELKQAVISVMLIISLIALITFFNEIAVLSIESADLPIACNNAEPCYVTAAKTYLTQIYDTGSEYAKTELRESIVNAKRASYGYNLNLNKIYLLFAGMSIRFNAGDTLVAERHGALFTQAAKLMGSVYSQKYFLDIITFGVAPLFILLGIVLRTFFFTRKLGGLLLAMAISLFIVYPLTYAFAWYTLNVTVYGERTLAVADPNCPGECTGTYPVAFFTDASGNLVQFSTIQSIMRAGINKANWAGGGPDGAFPGLVACRDLTAINLPSSVAPNACPDCPDYCRDVPFPSGIPGCDIAKCSACNAGCKIVRQRLNCQTDPACTGKCPLNCRTRVPLENKCFNNETGGIIAADLSASCSGCGNYPNWCRFLKNESGTLSLVYNDPVKDAACIGLDTDPTCPQQCNYITSFGEDTTCDSLCKDPATSTVCPKECRVDELLNDPLWTSTYDIDPPKMARACSETPEITAACATCAQHPECLVQADLASGCAKYPTVTQSPELCLSCPDYCRRASYSNVFIGISNTERDASNFPDVCVPTQKNEINCNTAGTPPACAASCGVSAPLNAPPKICRPLQPPAATDKSLCGACPDSARFKVRYTKSGACGGASQQAPAGGYTVLFTPAKNELAAGAPQQSAPAANALAADAPRPASSGAAAAAGAIRLAGQGGGQGQTPIMVSSRISPTTAYVSTPLSGYCKATIGNSGNLFYNYVWYLNEAIFYSGETESGAPSGEEVMVDVGIQSSSLAVGQEWVLSCQAKLGSQTSSWLDSSTVTIQPPQGEPPCTVTTASLALESQYDCATTGLPPACPSACQGGIVDLPNESVNPACNDVLVTNCPYGCRVKGDPATYLDSAACAGCAALPQVCFVDPTTPPPAPWPICSEYIGNGPRSCHSSSCLVLDQAACTAAGTGCAWNAAQGICDKTSCAALLTSTTCISAGCDWMYTAKYVEINNRQAPYGQDSRIYCEQCPEQCRLEGYEGSCGVEGNGADKYVDCSASACPSACRVPLPSPSSTPPQDECQPYPEGESSACQGCPALCRRSSDIFISTCSLYDSCAVGSSPTSCIDDCLLPDPPKKACEGCLDCDYDCIYYPSIRTDCSDICSDEALAGPVNIEPNDFIKSLPGAQTAYVETKSIGVLYLPAVVLPLFCIVIVIAFIRILSPVLGGDIEIPGLGRII